MSYKKNIYSLLIKPILCTGIILFTVTGCVSDDDDSDGDTGSIHFYNASANAPEIYLTIDENIDEDDEDEEDDFEKTFTGVSFTEASGKYELDSDEYYIELAWKDDDDDNERDEYEMLYQVQHEITGDSMQFIVVAGDIQSPDILTYDIELIDDDDDVEDDLFNIRLLNMHPLSAGIDVYLSKSDETFNEAQLLGQYSYTELSDNQKYEQDEYVFYITSPGSDEILYQSGEINYQYAAQYILLVRENPGVGSSPFTIDRVSNTNVENYSNEGDSAKFRSFNGIVNHQLIPDYQGTFDLSLNAIDGSIEVSSLNFGEFSDSFSSAQGDYSIDLTIPETAEAILQNHLVTLSENIDKTIFFYLTEDDVDLDGDGDVDEDGDGYVDEIEITINSLVVDNSESESIYDHQIQIINFIDNDDYNSVSFYFVKSDELINTTNLYRHVSYATPSSITLRNNTYSVYAVAKDGSSDVILITEELTLDESSKEMFLILEENINSPTGYQMTFADQKDS